MFNENLKVKKQIIEKAKTSDKSFTSLFWKVYHDVEVQVFDKVFDKITLDVRSKIQSQVRGFIIKH